jgi:hypothetical protein
MIESFQSTRLTAERLGPGQILSRHGHPLNPGIAALLPVAQKGPRLFPLIRDRLQEEGNRPRWGEAECLPASGPGAAGAGRPAAPPLDLEKLAARMQSILAPAMA